MSELESVEMKLENNVSIKSRETSTGKPFFIGVPDDDNVKESVSMEGILNGRKMSEVYSDDNNELNKEGITWDEAIKTLNYLAAACRYHSEKLDQINDKLIALIFGKSGFSTNKFLTSMHEYFYKKYESSIPIPGFKNLKTHSTGAKVIFDNPVKDMAEVGEITDPVDIVAKYSREERIAAKDSLGKPFTFTINYQTLYQAFAHHMLEKGNQYALTGAQLAELTKIFDKNDFDKKCKDWVLETAKNEGFNKKVVIGHIEKIQFDDISNSEYLFEASSMKLKMKIVHKGNRILLDFGCDKSGNYNGFRIFYHYDNRSLSLECYNKGGSWNLIKSEGSDSKRSILSEESDLNELREIGAKIVANAENRSDNILDDNTASQMYKFFDNLDFSKL
jgi:hypothetical protein